MRPTRGQRTGRVDTAWMAYRPSCPTRSHFSLISLLSVGTPSTVSQRDGAILHHTLGNGDFHVFENMFKSVTVAQASLLPSNAASEIDRVLRACLLHRRPVYIALPTDVAAKHITGSYAQLNLTHAPNPAEPEREAIEHIMQAINKAQRPAILIDGCAQRFHVEEELRRFIDRSGFPVYEAPMGKGIVSELHPHFRGSYVGELTPQAVREELEGMDLVIMVGAIKRWVTQHQFVCPRCQRWSLLTQLTRLNSPNPSPRTNNSDFNTGGFTFHISTEKLIELHSTHTSIFHATYNRVGFRGVLDKLAEKLTTPRPWVLPPPSVVGTVGKEGDHDSEIRHDFFVSRRSVAPVSAVDEGRHVGVGGDGMAVRRSFACESWTREGENTEWGVNEQTSRDVNLTFARSLFISPLLLTNSGTPSAPSSARTHTSSWPKPAPPASA